MKQWNPQVAVCSSLCYLTVVLTVSHIVSIRLGPRHELVVGKTSKFHFMQQNI